jgi:predicted lipoprotein with Yx(FWY)xxD motif
VTRSRPITFLASAAVAPLVARAVAGCGGGGPTASPPPAKTVRARAATAGVANTALWKILFDSKGRTLYLFQKDSGTKSTRFGACASAWPPLRADGKPTVGSGATASKAGTTTRSDGKQQITYNGHPPYLLAGDEKAGDTEDQGVTAFGGGWYAITPAGTKSPAWRRARTADRAPAAAAAIRPGGVAEERDAFFRAPDDQGRDAQLGECDSRRSGCLQSNCKSV